MNFATIIRIVATIITTIVKRRLSFVISTAYPYEQAIIIPMIVVIAIIMIMRCINMVVSLPNLLSLVLYSVMGFLAH